MIAYMSVEIAFEIEMKIQRNKDRRDQPFCGHVVKGKDVPQG